MMGYPFGWGWWGMGLGFVFMILFWGAIIALVVWLVRSLARPNPPPGPPSSPQSPLDIAKARYARGEISREEFEQLKKDLS